MSPHRVSMVLLAAALCGSRSAEAQSADPPGRVGRVSNVAGSVSLLPAGETEWRNASLNYPLTTGDALWADAGARSEIHVGSSSVHLSEGTSLGLDAVQDDLVQLYVGQGSLHIRLRALDQNDSYEIDTPSGTIVLRSAGDYRIDVTPDGQRTTVTVRDGDADVVDGDNSYRVRPGTSVTLTGVGSQPMANDQSMAPDDFERWADSRDRREDAASATRYVPREMVGYEDLDDYGDWQVDVRYGPTWYPRSVPVDWAPYRTGRWEYVQPWGWTWIDEAPWGFAPSHYGRWSHERGRWGWIPGTVRQRVVYAPALVAFVSGDGWGVSLSFGSNGGVGWIPLGPEEVYVPAYRASPTYTRNINITNVNVTNINVTNVNVTNIRYRNRNVPGAVTAVPRDDFMGSRPVGRTAVRVRPQDLASGRISATPIAAGGSIAPPPRGSRMDRGGPDLAGPVRHPPVELPRAPNPPRAGRGRRDAGAQATPQPDRPLAPPKQGPARFGGNQQPPDVARPVAPQPPTRDGGRGNRRPLVPPSNVTPTLPPTQGDARQDRSRNRPTQPPPAPTPSAPPPPVPAPVVPPLPTPVARPLPPRPDTVRQSPARPARTRPAQPDTSRGRRARPDTTRGGRRP